MKIEFTDQERQLLFQTVSTSTYAGQLAEIVVSVLAKIKGDAPEEPEEVSCRPALYSDAEDIGAE